MLAKGDAFGPRHPTQLYEAALEGAVMFFDMLAIPADAQHPKNAHLFIDYLLRADVSAKNSSAVHFAAANSAAYPLIDPMIYNDRGIFPSQIGRAHV